MVNGPNYSKHCSTNVASDNHLNFLHPRTVFKLLSIPFSPSTFAQFKEEKKNRKRIETKKQWLEDPRLKIFIFRKTHVRFPETYRTLNRKFYYRPRVYGIWLEGGWGGCRRSGTASGAVLLAAGGLPAMPEKKKVAPCTK